MNWKNKDPNCDKCLNLNTIPLPMSRKELLFSFFQAFTFFAIAALTLAVTEIFPPTTYILGFLIFFLMLFLPKNKNSFVLAILPIPLLPYIPFSILKGTALLVWGFLMILPWLRRYWKANIRGTKLYIFCDQEGHLHFHSSSPWVLDKDKQHSWELLCLPHHNLSACLRVWLGGWSREEEGVEVDKNEIMNWAPVSLLVTSELDDYYRALLEIGDFWGKISIPFFYLYPQTKEFHLYEKEITELLLFLGTNCPDVQSLLRYAREGDAARKRDASRFPAPHLLR